MNIEVLADADAVASQAAAIIAAEARDAVVARGYFLMAVSGGHTRPLAPSQADSGVRAPSLPGIRQPDQPGCDDRSGRVSLKSPPRGCAGRPTSERAV